jgi:hypothetical protein
MCSAPSGRSRLAFLTFFYLLFDGKKSKKLSPIIALAFSCPDWAFLFVIYFTCPVLLFLLWPGINCTKKRPLGVIGPLPLFL